MALRWKKNPRPTGLARVCAGPQGSRLRDGDNEYAQTVFFREFASKGASGWYWVAGNNTAGIARINTCCDLLQTEDEAKSSAMAYVRERIKAQEGAK